MNSRKKNTKKKLADKITVSIRNMSRLIWCEAAYNAKLDQVTMAEYIENLIKNDSKKSSR